MSLINILDDIGIPKCLCMMIQDYILFDPDKFGTIDTLKKELKRFVFDCSTQLVMPEYTIPMLFEYREQLVMLGLARDDGLSDGTFYVGYVNLLATLYSFAKLEPYKDLVRQSRRAFAIISDIKSQIDNIEFDEYDPDNDIRDSIFTIPGLV